MHAQDLKLIGVLICDMSLAAAPIIHANSGFQSMSGYSLEDLVGRSCRCLQGPKTDHASVSVIKEAIATGTSCHVRIFNYRKDGTTFNNMLTFRPVFDSEGHMVFGVSINIEIVDSFAQLKPLLTQVDRLNKLLPEKIPLPAPSSVRERVSVVYGGMIANRAEQRDRMARASAKSVKEDVPRSSLMTATEKATTLAKERAAEFQKKQLTENPVTAKSAANSPRQPSSARTPPMMQRPSTARLAASQPSASTETQGSVSAPLPRRSPSSGMALAPLHARDDLSRSPALLRRVQRSPRAQTSHDGVGIGPSPPLIAQSVSPPSPRASRMASRPSSARLGTK